MNLAPTWLARLRTPRLPRDPRRKALMWLTAGFLLFGVIEAGEPFERMLGSVRDRVRQHDASGDVVIVGIDDRMIEQLHEWPLRRRHYAQLIDRLNADGVSRIFIDVSFSTLSTAADDRALVDAVKRSRAEVTLSTSFSVDPIRRRRTELLPFPALRQVAQLASVNFRFDFTGVVRRLPYAMVIGGAPHPSFAAKIAGVAGRPGQLFRVDYSTRLASLPMVGGGDVLDGRLPEGSLRGRTVVIGPTATRMADNYLVPNVGYLPGVFIQALGAETLHSGRPLDLPWMLPFAIAWCATLGLFFLRYRTTAVVLHAMTVLALVGLPFLLDARLVFTEIVPALGLMLGAAAWMLWSSYRSAFRREAIVNAVSGLPNLNALRAIANEPDIALVAARIRNYPEVTASLAADHERILAEQIARRLALGSGGAVIYQGDEGIFAWLTPCETVSFTSDQFDAMHALFRNAVAVGDRHVDLSITFGLSSDAGLSPFNRLGGALMAADAAADAGLHWKLHEPVQPSDSSWKLSLLSRLDAAIDAEEIWVAFQPKIDVASNRIVGAEALVRWAHPEKGPINPVDFIPLAEQQNRIGKLTYYVLETAIRTAASINSHGIRFGMAVNLSVRLLDDPSLIEQVGALLDRHGLAPDLLTLEITETAAISGSRASIGVLEGLRAIGVGLSIDDYGTGFSNLENLRTIPANEIKIDRSFIDAIDHSRSDAVMVRSTIQMAHSLGQKVVAEGVERAETLQTLRRMGCDLVQGYLTGRPVKFSALARSLIQERRRHAA